MDFSNHLNQQEHTIENYAICCCETAVTVVKGSQNMKLEMPSTKKQNDFYPYCGCETEDVCEPCPHCGMCAATVDYCAC